MHNANKFLIEQIDFLEKKIVVLIEKYTALKQELDICKQENIVLKTNIKKQKAEINNFQNQYKISKIVTAIAPNVEDAETLKEKLDEYIAEIDKCIAFLNK